jgi:hypothetical protein
MEAATDGAGITIIAIPGGCGADTCGAMVIEGAKIPIIARESIVGDEGAVAIHTASQETSSRRRAL